MRASIARRSVRAILALMTVVALASAATVAHAASRTMREDYVGSFDPLTAGRCRTATVPINVGMVCFDLKPGDLRVNITATDQVMPDPGLFYMFIDASGDCVGDTGDPTTPCPNANGGCGSFTGIAVPKGSVRLEIYTNSIVLGPIKCVVSETTDGTGTATTGTITVKVFR